MAESFELPEKAESHRERVVGLIIAAIAVVLAIVSSIGHSTQNEQILAHVDASDQYAFYQAKKERGLALELQAENIGLNADHYSHANQIYAAQIAAKSLSEQQQLNMEEKEIQTKADDLMKEAARLEHKSGVLDLGEIALQISIVLCSITILTEQRLFAAMGVITAGVGAVVALYAILLT